MECRVPVNLIKRIQLEFPEKRELTEPKSPSSFLEMKARLIHCTVKLRYSKRRYIVGRVTWVPDVLEQFPLPSFFESLSFQSGLTQKGQYVSMLRRVSQIL